MQALFRDFFNDPVLFISFGILGLVIGLCVFYTVYFIHKIAHAKA